MAFWKWDKVVENLYIKVHTVQVPRTFQNEFDVAWHRGNNASVTEKRKPDKKGRIKYEELFSVPVTIFINKKDKSIRPKIVEFLLRRHVEGQQVKFYGRLHINVGEYYSQKEKPTAISVEMESERSVPPKIGLSVSFSPIPNDYVPDFQSQVEVNESDIENADEQPAKIKRNDWDQSGEEEEEREEVQEGLPSDLQAQKDEKPEEEQKPEEKDTELEAKAREVDAEDLKDIMEPKKRGSSARYQRSTSSILSSDKIPKPDEDQKKELDPSNTEGKAPTEMPMPITESTPLEAIPEEPKKAEEQKEYSDSYYEEESIYYSEEADEETIKKEASLVQKVLLKTWPNYKVTYCLDVDDKIACPPAALPFLATILHCQVLHQEQCLSAFLNNIGLAPLQNNCYSVHRFYTYAVILLFVQRSQYVKNRKYAHVDDFLNKLTPIFFNTLRGSLKTFATPFKGLVNRLCSTRFIMNELVEDFVAEFRKAEKIIKTQFPLVNNYVMRFFLTILDHKFANKLAKSNLRWNSKNAALWASFFTMVETTMRPADKPEEKKEVNDGLPTEEEDKKELLTTEEDELKKFELKVEFPVSKQICHLITLSPVIAKQPELTDTVCKDIPLSTVAFILDNIKPDEIMPLPIYIEEFCKAKDLPAKDIKPEKLKKFTMIDFEELSKLINYEAWRHCIEEDTIVEEYKYFKDYFKGEKD